MENININFFYLDLFSLKNAYYLYFDNNNFQDKNLDSVFLFFKKNEFIKTHFYLHIQFNSIEDIYIVNKVVYRSDYNDYTIKRQSFNSIKELSDTLRCLNIQLQFSLSSMKEARNIFNNYYTHFNSNLFLSLQQDISHTYLNYLLQGDDCFFTYFYFIDNTIYQHFLIDCLDNFEINQFYKHFTFSLIQIFGLSFFYNINTQLNFKHFLNYHLSFDKKYVNTNYKALFEYYFNENNQFLKSINFEESDVRKN